MMMPTNVAAVRMQRQQLIVVVTDVKRVVVHHLTPGDFGVANEASQELAVSGLDLVERSVVRAEIDDVFVRVVERRRLHCAERLETPQGIAVTGGQRVQPAVGRADENATTTY